MGAERAEWKRDWSYALVLLLVATVAAIAVCIWQATRFEDIAIDKYADARVSLTARVTNAHLIQATVDQDLRFISRLCIAERDELTAATEFFAGGRLDPLVAQIKERYYLGLLHGDAPKSPCGSDETKSYSAQRAYERFALQRSLTPGAEDDPNHLVQAAKRANGREHLFLLVAFAFAVIFVGLTIGDSMLRRRRPWFVGIGLVSILAMVCVATLQSPVEFTSAGMALSVAVLVVFVVAMLVLYRRAQATPSESRESAEPREQEKAREPVAVWSKRLAAVALAVFAWATLGWGQSLAEDRTATADSVTASAAAEHRLVSDQQAALADLDSSGEILDLEAERAGARQSPDPFAVYAVARLDAVRRALEDQHLKSEKRVRSDLDALTTTTLCPGVSFAPADPSELLSQWSRDPTVYERHLTDSATPGIACGVLAARARHAATEDRKFAVTDALAFVILGVALLLYALAIEDEHSHDIRCWVFAAATVGLVCGAGISVKTSLDRHGAEPALSGNAFLRDRALTEHDRREVAFAQHLAAARVAVLDGSCDEARAEAQRAVDVFSTGDALAQRARATSCTDDSTLISGAIAPEMLDSFVRDLEDAQKRGVSGFAVAGDLGWARLLQGLERGGHGETSLRDGLDETHRALSEIERDDETSPLIHPLRYNEAFAELALHNEDAATRYRDATERLVASSTEGATSHATGFSDPGLQAFVAASALADLELLPGRSDEYDSYRSIIVTTLNGKSNASTGTATRDLRLEVLPQEFRIQGGGSGTPRDASIVFYYRASQGASWSVLADPSVATVLGDRACSPQSCGWLNQSIRVGGALKRGEYRADIYIDGRLTHRLQTDGGVDAGFERLAFNDLGMSVVLPSNWKRDPADAFGLQATVGTGASNLVIDWRASVSPSSGLDSFLAEELDNWLASNNLSSSSATSRTVRRDAFGLPAVRLWDDSRVNTWAAIGFVPYVSDDPSCGGAELRVAVQDPDPDKRLAIRDSLRVDDPPALFGVNSTRDVSTDDFSLSIPAGWHWIADTTGNADARFFAKQCSTLENLIVSVKALSGGMTLDSYVADYRRDLLQAFSQLSVEGQRRTSLPSGLGAVELDYTFGATGVRTQQRVLLAVKSDKIFVMTITTPSGDANSRSIERTLRSFNVRT